MQKTLTEPELYFLVEEPYHGSHDFFYNSKDFPAIKVLESNWQIIRDEIMPLLNNSETISVKNLNPPYLSSPHAWKNLYFMNFGWQNHKNCDRYPKTFELIKKVPNLVFAGITVLEPHSKVLPHNGETNTTIRCHLGLKIPAPLPICGVRVGNEEQGWEEGKVMMFSDAHYHTTWNDSDERRFVLIFDIVREEYSAHKHAVCAKALGALSLKYFYNYWPGLKKLPMLLIKAIHFFFSSIWFLYLPIQNRLRLP